MGTPDVSAGSSCPSSKRSRFLERSIPTNVEDASLIKKKINRYEIEYAKLQTIFEHSKLAGVFEINTVSVIFLFI